VTANVRTIRSVPLGIQPAAGELLERLHSSAELEVRGEVHFPRTAFERLNAAREQEGEALFANPRNAAAGTLRLLDPRIVADRALDAYFYSFSAAARPPLPTHWENLEALRAAGFKVSRRNRLCRTMAEVKQVCTEYEAGRDALDYEIDGV